MKINLKPILVFAALLYLVLFAVQGQYMALFQGGLQDYPDGQRMLLRSAHIYAMLCSLPALVLGMYLPSSRPPRWYEIAMAALFLIAPMVMLIGYFVESNQTETLERPMMRLTLIILYFACFLWPLLHLMAESKEQE